MNHITFPSIAQFRDVVRRVRDSAAYHNVPLPVIKFRGSVKLHGTNASIVRPLAGNVNDIWCQSRERVITPESDNAGFAMWTHSQKESLNKIFDRLAAHYKYVDTQDLFIQIYGEWAGAGIHKSVGINKIEKSFFVFAIRVSKDAESTEWWPDWSIKQTLENNTVAGLYNIYDFPTWEVHIDFTNPETVQNKLIEITNQVESHCPVAHQFIGNTDEALIGEGVVWKAIECNIPEINYSSLIFKVKGEKHSVSKVKTLAAVDIEKVATIAEFVEYAVTENRLKQGLDKLKERGLRADPINTGEFIRWVVGDILKEELDTLAASGLSTKDVTSKIASNARQFFMNNLE